MKICSGWSNIALVCYTTMTKSHEWIDVWAAAGRKVGRLPIYTQEGESIIQWREVRRRRRNSSLSIRHVSLKVDAKCFMPKSRCKEGKSIIQPHHRKAVDGCKNALTLLNNWPHAGIVLPPAIRRTLPSCLAAVPVIQDETPESYSAPKRTSINYIIKMSCKGGHLLVVSRLICEYSLDFWTKIKSKTIFGNGIMSPFGWLNHFFDS